MSSDPTYDKHEIETDPIWHLAWVLSEIQNDNAPLGWSKYIFAAKCLLDKFDIREKSTAHPPVQPTEPVAHWNEVSNAYSANPPDSETLAMARAAYPPVQPTEPQQK